MVNGNPSHVSKWIKNIVLEEELDIDKFTLDGEIPEQVATIVLDEETVELSTKRKHHHTRSYVRQMRMDKAMSMLYQNRITTKLVSERPIYKSKRTKKRRKTLIKFEPSIADDEWKKEREWLYILTVNNKIVKIGGTRKGLKSRTKSYLSGHYVKERGEKQSSSSTNAYIYNTFEHYIRSGYIVEMYGIRLPPLVEHRVVFGKKMVINAQTYHAYESHCLLAYKEQTGHYPVLSSNCDPSYRCLVS